MYLEQQEDKKSLDRSKKWTKKRLKKVVLNFTNEKVFDKFNTP